MSLKARDLIMDNWDREGIVVQRVKRPSAAWLADQTAAECEHFQKTPRGGVFWSFVAVVSWCLSHSLSLSETLRLRMQ